MWETKIEKTHAKEKQSHAQDNFYMVRQFAYVHRVAGISLLLGKKYKVRLQCFHTISRRQQYNKTLITKNSFYILRTWFTMGHKTGQNFFPGVACRPKPSLYGLSLRKSPIKNHATLFGSGRVVNRIKHKLGSTKPNKALTNAIRRITGTGELDKIRFWEALLE